MWWMWSLNRTGLIRLPSKLRGGQLHWVAMTWLALHRPAQEKLSRYDAFQPSWCKLSGCDPFELVLMNLFFTTVSASCYCSHKPSTIPGAWWRSHCKFNDLWSINRHLCFKISALIRWFYLFSAWCWLPPVNWRSRSSRWRQSMAKPLVSRPPASMEVLPKDHRSGTWKGVRVKQSSNLFEILLGSVFNVWLLHCSCQVSRFVSPRPEDLSISLKLERQICADARILCSTKLTGCLTWDLNLRFEKLWTKLEYALFLLS